MRYRFVVLVLCWPSLVAAQSITARDVISRIKEEVGIPWSDQTVDTFKAGDPDATVTGIAVTMMATFDVLQRAAAEGHNLIITHEPTFYGHLDETGQLEADADPIYRAKKRFIDEHGLIVWRFHDYWHQRVPDGVTEGMIRQLGWEHYPREAGANVFTAPETTVRDLAKDIERRFDIKTIRVVGDPDLRVTKLAFAAGFPGFAPQQRLFRRDDVEVLVMGEAHEWETILYGADAVAAGMRKALIVMGHIPSEQAGMENCAEWMKGFVTEVPVAFVPAKEPFWRP